LATVTQAYRFALDPTPRQRRVLASHCGAARVAYNWGLKLVDARLQQRRAGEDVEVPWTLPALRREWNRAKDQVAPWWAENSKEAYSSGLDGLARALKNWTDSRTGRRKGRPVGFPRGKRKGRSRDACRFTTGPLRVEADRKHITLPRIGGLKTHESTRKLARRLEQGTARILAATITRTADRWCVSFTVEVERHIPTGNGTTTVVGMDVGIRRLAVLSTGVTIPQSSCSRTPAAQAPSTEPSTRPLQTRFEAPDSDPAAVGASPCESGQRPKRRAPQTHDHARDPA
jgi:putative transposase